MLLHQQLITLELTDRGGGGGQKLEMQHCMAIFFRHSHPLRRDKLNSQFIVTKFSILHAGGRSLFRFQTSRETRMAMLELEIARAPPTN